LPTFFIMNNNSNNNNNIWGGLMKKYRYVVANALVTRRTEIGVVTLKISHEYRDVTWFFFFWFFFKTSCWTFFLFARSFPLLTSLTYSRVNDDAFKSTTFKLLRQCEFLITSFYQTNVIESEWIIWAIRLINIWDIYNQCLSNSI